MTSYYIKKANGKKEKFQDTKLLGSLLKSKLTKNDAETVLPKIKKILHPGATTADIRKQTFTLLCETHLPHAQLYNLRVALSELPPKTFERYIMKLMQRDGYETEWEQIVQGAGTRHEVDVSAKKESEWYLVECKRRRDFNKLSGLGNVLQVQARYEDIQEGFQKKKTSYNFTRAWVINNAKFSQHAKEYSRYKGLWLTGWGYPKKASLNEWIQNLEFYPVTLFRIQKKYITQCITNDILSFFDVEQVHVSKTKKVVGEMCHRKLLAQIKAIRQCG